MHKKELEHPPSASTRLFRGKFPAEPTIAFRRNRNLKSILGQTYLSKNKKVLKKNPIIGKCNQCLSKSNNLCCRQTISTSTFYNEYTGTIYNILHNLNCKSRFIIYLGNCTLCKKTQYVGKSEFPWNIRLNNH